jgi:hypothetical protein
MSDDPGERPGSSEPGRVFRDGDFSYEVSVSPASFPTRLVAGPTTGGITDALFAAGVESLGGLAARLVDRRWKVTVCRGRTGARAVSWRVVRAEFFPDREAAEQHRTTLLTNWPPGAMADVPPMSFADLRKLRLNTKA